MKFSAACHVSTVKETFRDTDISPPGIGINKGNGFPNYVPNGAGANGNAALQTQEATSFIAVQGEATREKYGSPRYSESKHNEVSVNEKLGCAKALSDIARRRCVAIDIHALSRFENFPSPGVPSSCL